MHTHASKHVHACFLPQLHVLMRRTHLHPMQNNTDVCSTTLPIMPVRRFKAELGISKIAEPEKGKTKFNG